MNTNTIGFGIFLGVMLLYFFTVPSAKPILKTFWKNYDDTDDLANKEASGLILYIDHGTGCHYLCRGVFDTLVPRLDKNGKQVCEYQQKEEKQ